MKSKYITFKFTNDSEINALVFSETLTHKEVFNMVDRKYFGAEIVGAGFVMVDSDNNKIRVQLYGKSTSLDVGQSANGRDEFYVKRALGI